MDTQIGATPETEGEWAVDRILSHAGSKTDAVFEIKWTSGDTTWLPYYQITHLQALTDYLDLLGESNIRKLPKGTGKPPHEDPQLFVGSLSFDLHPQIPPTNAVAISYKDQPNPATYNITSLEKSPEYLETHHSLTTLITHSDQLMPPFRRPASRPGLRGVNHPLFTRISPLVYLMKDLDYPVHTTIHVAQIAEYVQFDEELRALSKTSHFTSVPIGYLEFSNAWNSGADPDDLRRFSTIYLADDPERNDAYPSTYPIQLSAFHITPAQAGIHSENTQPQSDPLQADIAHEFAAIMVTCQKKQRLFEEQRKEKKVRAFAAGNAARNRNQTHSAFKRRQNQKKRPQARQPAPLRVPSSPPDTPVSTTANLPPVPEDTEIPGSEDDLPPAQETTTPVPMDVQT
jgi:hypothetical protein